jgi:putative FmdB family regulatory protein
LALDYNKIRREVEALPQWKRDQFKEYFEPKPEEESMPLYEYRCVMAPCGKITTDIKSVAGRFDSPNCEECGAETRLEISAPSAPVMDPARPVKIIHQK